MTQKEFGPKWRYIHPNGGHCDYSKEEFAREMERHSPGSRVVELAPVDPLERAVVEAAVAWDREHGMGWTPDRGYAATLVLTRAIKALIAAKEGA